MRRLALSSLIVILLIGDQWTKHLARETLMHDTPRRIGIVTLLYTENRGAFLSLGSNLSEELRTAVFDGVVAIGLLAALVVLFSDGMKRRFDDVALALIIAGGIGNLIDRLRFQGLVTDFLYVAVGPLHTGVFNIADMAITFGVIWLMISWALVRRKPYPR
jgi:signal peptidase II